MERNEKQLFFELGAVIGAYIIYGIFINHGIFDLDMGAWMILVGIGWAITTFFFTFPFAPICYSFTAMFLSFMIIVFGAILYEPIEKVYIPYGEKNGTAPNCQWNLRITYKEYDLNKESKFTFTGTFNEANIALNEIINEWNEKNPSNPVINSRAILCDFPK